MCVGGWERNVDRRLRRRAARRTFQALLSSTQSPHRTRPQVGTVNGSQHFISLPPLLCWALHPVLPCLAQGWTTPDLGISWGSVHRLLPQGYLYLLFTAPFSQLTLHQPRPTPSSREATFLLLSPSTAKGSHLTVLFTASSQCLKQCPVHSRCHPCLLACNSVIRCLCLENFSPFLSYLLVLLEWTSLPPSNTRCLCPLGACLAISPSPSPTKHLPMYTPRLQFLLLGNLP